MKQNTSRTLVLLTGAFLHHSCWTEWKDFFEQAGYNVLIPPWPYKDASPEELRRRQPDPDIASIRLTRLIEYFTEFVIGLPEQPVVIGHSIGGLIAQQLLVKQLVSKAVAIHSVPPQGIFTTKFSFLRAGWGPLGFFTSVRKTFLMSFRQFQYGFVNGMPLEEQEKAYRLVIPESKQVVRDTITAAAKLDFNKPRPPLLLIAGEADRTVPASLNLSNYKRYQHNPSVTDYKVFAGRTHFVLGQPGWQEIAAFVIKWLQSSN